MKAIIVSFRRGKNTYKPRQYILLVEGYTKKDSVKLINKKVTWTSPQGKEIKGIISALHGNRGTVRARFEKGLPGQAIAGTVEIE